MALGKGIKKTQYYKDKPKSPNPPLKPTAQTSLQIKNTIKDYFYRGYSGAFVMMKTGFAKDTVYSYYREFLEESREDTNFIDQQISAKKRYEHALDRIIETNEEQVARLKGFIKPGRLNIKLETILTNASNALERVHNHKVQVEIAPTLDISLKELLLEKYGINLDEELKNKQAQDAEQLQQ